MEKNTEIEITALPPIKNEWPEFYEYWMKKIMASFGIPRGLMGKTKDAHG